MLDAAAVMAARKTSNKIHNKIHNKKLRRRREGLSTKAYEYGDLDGVELALFIRYPKRGDFYSYLSAQGLLWIQDVEKMVTKDPARQQRPGFAKDQQLDVGSKRNQRTSRQREEESRANQAEAKEAKTPCNARRRRGRAR